MKSLPECFDCCFLINLPERGDRLRSAKRQFKRLGWKMGVGGVQIFAAHKFAEPAGFPNAAHRGCSRSHLECLREAQRRRCASILIIEDDIALSSCLLRIAPSVDRILKQGDWGFIYFGHYGTGFDQIADRNTDSGQISFDEWRQDLLTTYFYAVNGSIFPMLIDHLSTVENGLPGDQEMGPMPIDGAMNIFRRKNPSIQCLIANPKLGWQSSSRSDIAPRRLDAITYLRPVGGFLRGVKEAFRSRGR